MTGPVLYAIGTLITWIAWVFAFRGVLLVSKLFTKGPGLDEARIKRGLVIVGFTTALLFIVGASFPMPAGGVAPEANTWRFPLVWFVLPYSGWLFVLAFIFGLVRLTQGALSINPDDKVAKLKGAGGWAAFAIVCVGLYRLDPANKITILRGGIDFTPAKAFATVISLVAATLAMALAARETRTRGYATGIVTQAALLAGSVVFGLPFAFLLSTSFKEDVDMSSPNGIVWIPHVKETVPFFDKRDPTYQGTFKGHSVEASVIGKNPDGTIRLDIQRPMAERGTTFDAKLADLKEIPKDAPVVTGTWKGVAFTGYVVEEMENGQRRVHITSPANLAGQEQAFPPSEVSNVRHVGLRWENYPDALGYLPPETNSGLVYLQNTLVIVVLSVLGTCLSSAIVAYAFSRLQFPGKTILFSILLSTMMLPGAVTLMPQFLIFRDLGWIDTLYPLWVPAFFGSAFNIFLLRQFFMQIPMELEDAAKIDGCNYAKTFWDIMVPQIKPALAVVAVTTFVGAWNNFMGPLIYINSPEHMPLSYALQLFSGDRGNEPGLLMAFATLCMLPVLLVFFFAQRYFIEGVTLSGLGGR
jgi:multiple sugar transport system permease protein